MKVYKGQGPVLPQPNKDVNKKGTGEDGFQKIMDQVRSQTEKQGEITGRENLGPVPDGIQIVHGADRINEPLNMAERKQVLEELKQTLDIVDFYAARLADSSLSINGINPLIGHLEDRLEILRNMESAPGMPEKLRPVISDMVITIGTEIAKFKRGDYV